MSRESLAFLSTSDRDVPVVNLLNDLFHQAAQEKWSDLHFETQENQSMRIRARIRGRLRVLETISDHQAILLITKLRYRAKLAIDETRKEQDGRFTQEVEGRRVGVRLSITPTIHGFSAVCRLLDSENSGIAIEKLGMPPEVEKLYRWGLGQREGAILCAGPTGSGKTTTLYAGVAILNREDSKFITAEDPVEYTQDGLQQVPVGFGTGRTFASVVRTMMRQDPDDILVGEIRDEDTAIMTMRAAMTGHKALASIHANSAPETYFRLENLGVPKHLMAVAIRVVIAQRIVRTICPHCREQRPVEFPEFFRGTGIACPEFEWIGSGCEHCAETPGYAGRRVLFEAIRFNQAMRRALGDPEAMMAAAQEQPQYKPLRVWGAQYIVDGITNTREVVRELSDVIED